MIFRVHAKDAKVKTRKERKGILSASFASHFLCALCVNMSAINIHAQDVLSNGGARNEALGGLSAVTKDEWALWRNPAGLDKIRMPVISMSVRQLRGVRVLTRSALLGFHTKAGSFAAGISSFGDDIYNESAASLGFAHHLGNTSFGIRADVFQLHVDHFIRRTFGVTVGTMISLGSRVSLGAMAKNVNLPEWARGQPLPVVLSAAVLFKPSEAFSLAAELEKNTDFDPTVKGGVEYSMKDKFFLRTGFNLFPNAAFGGFGLRWWRLRFDYSMRFGYLPGLTQQLSVSVLPGNIKKGGP